MKQSYVFDMIMPRYNKLKIENILPLIIEVDKLINYFLYYQKYQLQDRKFMFSIIDTLKIDKPKEIDEGAKKNRSLNEEKNDDEI